MPRKSSPVVAADRAAAIAERAYFKALRRGFVPGFELEDWLEAEREIIALTPPAPRPRAKRSSAVSKSRAASKSKKA